MRIDKVVLKLKPNNYWSIGEHESWFADMAKEGLHLSKMGIFAHFTKGKPLQMSYRIDALQSKAITSEQLQMYAESGWSFVTSYGIFNVFSSPIELNATELHTDPGEQAHTLKLLDKKLARNALLLVIVTLVLVGLLYMSLFIGSTPTLLLVKGQTIQPVILLAMLYTAYNTIQAAVAIRSLRKKLLEGKPINHFAPWRRKRKVNLIISNAIIVLTALAAALPYIQIVKSETEALENMGNDIPIIRLADVEQNSNMEQKKMYDQYYIDRGNKFDYEWSILAPIQYESDEHGIVSGKKWGDGSGEYTPSINNWVYKLTFPSMSKALVDDLIKWHSSWDPKREYVQMEHSDFDLLIVNEEEAHKEIFAAKGKGVMYVSYYGYADVDRLITNAALQINLIAD